MELSEVQIQRYSRHILLPQVGGEGQRRLLAASAAVAFPPEAAGTAAALAVYLAAGGLGRIGWWPAPGEAAAGPGTLRGLADVFAPGGVGASLAALNPDARLEAIRTADEAAAGFDLLVLLDEGEPFEAAAERFQALGKALLRGRLRGWSGALREGAGAFEGEQEDVFHEGPPGEGDEPLPPAAPEGALGALLASAALRLLLGRDSPVGSTAQARFDLSRGRLVAAPR